jgi:hypothetical protein
MGGVLGIWEFVVGRGSLARLVLPALRVSRIPVAIGLRISLTPIFGSALRLPDLFSGFCLMVFPLMFLFLFAHSGLSDFMFALGFFLLAALVDVALS